jgi:hypothetical protein
MGNTIDRCCVCIRFETGRADRFAIAALDPCQTEAELQADIEAARLRFGLAPDVPYSVEAYFGMPDLGPTPDLGDLAEVGQACYPNGDYFMALLAFFDGHLGAALDAYGESGFFELAEDCFPEIEAVENAFPGVIDFDALYALLHARGHIVRSAGGDHILLMRPRDEYLPAGAS